MKKPIFHFLSFLVIIFLSSCEKQINEPNSQEDIVANNSEDIIELPESNLANRIIFHNRNASIVATQSIDGVETVTDPISHIATVLPLRHQGKTLHATHLDITNNRAYISYASSDTSYVGGVDVINTSNIQNPRSLTSLIYTNFKVNAVVVGSSRMFFSGTRRPSSFTPAVTTAESATFGLHNLNSSGRPSGSLRTTRIGGFNGTDIAFHNNKVYFLSGNNGRLTVFNTAGVQQDQHVVDDGRGIAVSSTSNRLAILTGNSKIMLSGITNLQQQTVLHIPDETVGTKRNIDFFEDKLIVASGRRGLMVYADGNNVPAVLLQQFPMPVSQSGVSSSELVTRSVSYNPDNGLVVTANGAAGLWVFRKNNATQLLELVGKISTPGSFNYVKSRGDLIFAATADGGMQIFRINM